MDQVNEPIGDDSVIEKASRATKVLGVIAPAAASLLRSAAKQGTKADSKGATGKVGATMAVLGTAIAGASTVAETAGVAAVVHSSGAAILTSVGAGGTGYIAGTAGTQEPPHLASQVRR